jgi:hypothetical protein
MGILSELCTSEVLKVNISDCVAGEEEMLINALPTPRTHCAQIYRDTSGHPTLLL